MRKSAKRFLSTILALTMLCSCMAVMNISAFAADTVSVDLTSLSSSSYTDGQSLGSATGITVYATDNGITASSGYVEYTSDANTDSVNGSNVRRVLKIVTTVAGTITVEAYQNSTSEKTHYLYTADLKTYETATLSAKEDFSVTMSDAAAGTYYFGSGGTKARVYRVKFTPSAASATTNITITGIPEDADVVVGLGTKEIEQNEDSTYTVTVGTEYTVWANGYTSDTFTVSDTTTTSVAVSMSETNVYFDSYTEGIDGISSSYDYSDDIWSLYDEEEGNIGYLYYGLKNATGLSKAVIEGKFAPSTNSSSWSLLNFIVSDGEGSSKTISIRTIKDTSTFYNLYIDSNTLSPTTLAPTANEYVSYELTLDFDSGIASLSLNGGDEVTVEFGTGYSQVSQIYAQTATKTRNIYMTTPTATYTYFDPKFDAETSTISGAGGKIYYVVGVTDKEVAENESYVLADRTDETNISGKSSEVYYGVTVNGETFAASDMVDDPYVVAFEILSSGNEIDKAMLSERFYISYTEISDDATADTEE